MSRLAILNSETLTGKEVKVALAGRPELAREVRLLAGDPENVGVVTEGVDGAAFVQEITDESLRDIEIVIVCHDGPAPGESTFPADATVIHVAPPEPIADGTVVVASVNPGDATAGPVLVSPHPVVVALALLLDPLRPFGIGSAACWAVLPASTAGQPGIDELLDQTRAILSFQGDQPTEIFGQQLAFNVLPADLPAGQLAAEVSAVLGDEVKPSLQLLQAGVFHGVALGVQVVFSELPAAAEIRAALADRPLIAFPADSQSVCPVAAAGQPAVLVGPIDVFPGDDTLKLSATLDNLTVGTAANVVGILETLAAPRH